MFKISLLTFGIYLASYTLRLFPVRILGFNNFWSDIFDGVFVAAPVFLGIFLGIGMLTTKVAIGNLNKIYMQLAKITVSVIVLVLIPTILWALQLEFSYHEIISVNRSIYFGFSLGELVTFLSGFIMIAVSVWLIARSSDI